MSVHPKVHIGLMVPAVRDWENIASNKSKWCTYRLADFSAVSLAIARIPRARWSSCSSFRTDITTSFIWSNVGWFRFCRKWIFSSFPAENRSSSYRIYVGSALVYSVGICSLTKVAVYQYMSNISMSSGKIWPMELGELSEPKARRLNPISKMGLAKFSTMTPWHWVSIRYRIGEGWTYVVIPVGKCHGRVNQGGV